MAFFVYILASRRNGTPYIGQTDDLWRRVTEHEAHALPGFTAKYGVTRLVWYEGYETRLRERANEDVEPGLEARANREIQPGLA